MEQICSAYKYVHKPGTKQLLGGLVHEQPIANSSSFKQVPSNSLQQHSWERKRILLLNHHLPIAERIFSKSRDYNPENVKHLAINFNFKKSLTLVDY